MLLLDFCCSHNDCSYLCYHQSQTFKTLSLWNPNPDKHNVKQGGNPLDFFFTSMIFKQFDQETYKLVI